MKGTKDERIIRCGEIHPRSWNEEPVHVGSTDQPAKSRRRIIV